MEKTCSLLSVAVLVLAATVTPWKSTKTLAQTSPVVSCSNQPTVSPMQGHYTGPWHSDGDYHFSAHFPAFNGYPTSTRDIEMKIIIDGKLDVSVNSSGQLSGTATGNVNAPIFHDGMQDISSGTGTISGQLAGVFTGAGATIVLSHPIIDMHWGTFGGSAVETFPQMPDYHFAAGAFDCTSSQGTIAEQDFPVMNITNDSTGQLTQAPGIGTANGTWQLTSDDAGQFADLSHQVDAFINQANSLLTDSSTHLTVSLFTQQIMQPLRRLEDVIQANPNVARCLLERLGAWEAAAVPALLRRARAVSSSNTPADLRQASDLLRSARLLNMDCSLPENDAGTAVLDAEKGALDRAISSRDWTGTGLLLRELLLLQGDGGRPSLQDQVDHDIRSLMAMSGASDLLATARVAYALGDDDDASGAVTHLPTRSRLREADGKPPWVAVGNKKCKVVTRKVHGKKKRVKVCPKTRSTPVPRPTATPTPTPTPQPRTLQQILASGVASIQVAEPIGSPPMLFWQSVSGASRYLVVVAPGAGAPILWAWSGNSTSVAYGDTAIEGAPGTGGDGWSIALPAATYTWSVLAFNDRGQVVGVRFRAKSRAAGF
jgi:hypothetical protein